MVGGRGRAEHDTTGQPGGHRVGVGDGAWVEHGACDVHGHGETRSDGMRGDGVGVGDVGAVHGGARVTWHSTSYSVSFTFIT